MYELFKNNEVTPNFAYSEIAEAVTRLRESAAAAPALGPRLQLRVHLGRLLARLADEWVNAARDAAYRASLAALLPRLLSAWQRAFDVRAEERTVARLAGLHAGLPGNFAEVRNAAEALARETDSRRADDVEAEWAAEGPWARELAPLRAELEGVEQVRLALAEREAAVARLEQERGERAKELERVNVAKMNLESKAIRLQGLANKVQLLEAQLEEGRAAHKKQAAELEALRAGPRAVEAGEERAAAGRTKVSVQRPEESRAEYKPLTKFEVNSLNAVLSNTLAELNGLRAQDLLRRLRGVAASVPTLEGGAAHAPVAEQAVRGCVGELRRSRGAIKREIAALRVVDLRDAGQLAGQLRAAQESRFRREGLLWQSKRVLAQLSELDEEVLLGYNVDLNRELGAEQEPRPPRVLARVQMVDDAGAAQGVAEEAIVPASVEIR